MRGRKPVPTNLKLLQGTAKPSRTHAEPPVEQLDSLKPPKGMSKGARRVWKRIAPQLQNAGLLFNLDATAARILCDNVDRYEIAAAKACAEPVVQASNGTPMMSPWLVIANRAQDQLLKLLTEFGMTPSARARIDTGTRTPAPGNKPPQDQRKASRYFGGG